MYYLVAKASHLTGNLNRVLYSKHGLHASLPCSVSSTPFTVEPVFYLHHVEEECVTQSQLRLFLPLRETTAVIGA